MGSSGGVIQGGGAMTRGGGGVIQGGGGMTQGGGGMTGIEHLQECIMVFHQFCSIVFDNSIQLGTFSRNIVISRDKS